MTSVLVPSDTLCIHCHQPLVLCEPRPATYHAEVKNRQLREIERDRRREIARELLRRAEAAAQVRR